MSTYCKDFFFANCPVKCFVIVQFRTEVSTTLTLYFATYVRALLYCTMELLVCTGISGVFKPGCKESVRVKKVSGHIL